MDVQQLLLDYKNGKIELDDVLSKLKDLPYQDLGFAMIDSHRELRTGFPEVIYCEDKSAEQIIGIISSMKKNRSKIIFGTRIGKEKFSEIDKHFKDTTYNSDARAFYIGKIREQVSDIIMVICAGTSDFPVAEEAALTAEVLGCKVDRLYDVGVAGLHRVLSHKDRISDAKTIIVVAGMDGALPSVVGGLVGIPIIAVPTSVGYGANFNGLSALLSMLNSCAPGIAVMNIDNGFGAGYFASRIVLNR